MKLELRASILVIAAVVAVLALTGSASAATVLGSTCSNPANVGGQMHIDTTHLTVPERAVITSWGFGFQNAAVGSLGQRLTVLSPYAGDATKWTVKSIADVLPDQANGSSTASRIPVEQGDIIGSFGPSAALYCSASSSTMLGTSVGAAAVVGTTYQFGATAANLTPDLSATLEPDADGDGYGDETQDACPRSAALHTACPPPNLDALVLSTKTSFRAVVTSDVATTVVARGAVKLGSAKHGGSATLDFSSAAVSVGASRLATLTLKYPAPLKNALKRLSKRKSLKLTVTIIAPSPSGDSTVVLSAKLHGTKKSKKK